MDPIIAPHGKSIGIHLLAVREGNPEITVAINQLLVVAREIKQLCERYSPTAHHATPVFMDTDTPPFALDDPTHGLILCRGGAETLTIKSVYPRQGAIGEPVTVYLSFPVAMRLAEFMGMLAVGGQAPRQRTRSAPGAKPMETDVL